MGGQRKSVFSIQPSLESLILAHTVPSCNADPHISSHFRQVNHPTFWRHPGDNFTLARSRVRG